MRIKINMKIAYMILTLSKTKEIEKNFLNKLLFFSDMLSFLKNGGKTISKEVYIKRPHGVVPKGVDVVRSVLVGKGLLEERIHKNLVYVEYGYRATNDVDYEKVESRLSSNEIDVLKNVYSKFSNLPPSALAQKLHDFEPWASTQWNGKLHFSKIKTDSTVF